jgi:hypothetical protein
MIVIVAGVDLLGKFYDGNDLLEKLRKRFVNFSVACLNLSPSEAEQLYTVGNCLMHSFGLYDSKRQQRIMAPC